MLFKTRSQFAILMQTLSQHHWWWTLLPSTSSSSFHHFIFLLIFFTSPHLITLSSQSSPSLPPPPITTTITDLIVNVGENTLLECADYHHQELSLKETSSSFPLSKPPTLKYLWCRYEEDWVTGTTTATATSTAKLLQTGNENSKNKQNNNKNCFEGDRFFVASEGKVSTVVYRCKILNRDSEQLIASRLWKLYVDAFESVLAKRETMSSPSSSSSSSFSQEPIVQQSIERSPDNFDSPPSPSISPSPSPLSYSPPPNRLSPSSIRCPPPRCKPYASVVSARCGRIELAIRYPATQYGYNRSADHWGTISCGGGDGGDGGEKEGEEEGDKRRGGYYRSYSSEHSPPPPITGYQLWLIGYGIVKKFKPNDPIVMEDLVPGKRYCFNGWAVNRCGSGPVFTLEGVCAENGEDCGSSSDEHCELDVDYSY